MLGHDYESVVERVSFIAREYQYYKMLASVGLPSLGFAFMGLAWARLPSLAIWQAFSWRLQLKLEMNIYTVSNSA
jgi:hypothetical protein